MNITELERRKVCVVTHDGSEETIDETRRPLYQHLIVHELIGGPAIIRFGDTMDALVVTTAGFQGDDVATVEVLPAGTYATLDYEGPAAELPSARAAFMAQVSATYSEHGPLLQVHLFDEIDGEVEQQFQVYLPSEQVIP